MPLLQGKSKSTVSKNIGTLTGEIGKSPHVQSRDQAVAIALSEARRSAHRASGGRSDDDKPRASKLEKVDNEALGALGDIRFKRRTLTKATPEINDAGDTIGEKYSRQRNTLALRTPDVRHGYPYGREDEFPDAERGAWRKPGGDESFQLGGGAGAMLNAFPGSGAVASEFKGPLHSPVAGRTDRIHLNVKPGSYVVPADVTSAIGQGNTLAGQEVLKRMFTPHGLSGMAPQSHGSGQHKPHGLPGMAEGGRGEPVQIVAAGGEHIISPDDIEGKFGNLKHGHDSLDEFVKEVRRREIKRLRTAPPPKGSSKK